MITANYPSPEPPEVPTGRPPLRPQDFSSLDELRAAQLAEIHSGLCAREIFRPAGRGQSRLNVFPDEPRLRCHLGRWQRGVNIKHPAIPGICDAFEVTADLFELVAYGRTWADAAAAAALRGVRA